MSSSSITHHSQNWDLMRCERILMEKQLASIYCERCKKSYWFELYPEDFSKVQNGLLQKVFLHTDHILSCEVDYEGSVRSNNIIDFEFNFLRNLQEDSAQTFYYLNQQMLDPAVIDILDSHTPFSQFMKQMILRIQEQAIQLTNNPDFMMSVKIDRTSMKLISNQILLRLIGRDNFSSIGMTGYGQRGGVFDFSNYELESVPWSLLENNYEWFAILLPNRTPNDTIESVRNSVADLGVPFFVEKLSNASLEQMFNFIFKILLQME